jgi:hypothetical protein
MRSVPEICMPYTSYGVTITPWAVFLKRAFARSSNRMRAGTTLSTPTRSISAAGGMPEDLSALSFCKDRFCKNGIDPKIRVPSVPSVLEYRMYLPYTWYDKYTYFSVHFTFFFQDCPQTPCFRALKINGSENRKDFDRRTKPFHEIVLL